MERYKICVNWLPQSRTICKVWQHFAVRFKVLTRVGLCIKLNIWVKIFFVLISKFNFFSCRTESAKKESVDSVAELLSADDLDQMESPEMVLLSAVSGEDAQDRSDRKILMPWVKFLWESYCQCLELLRTNVRVERLYHDIAQQAFRFCLKYQVRNSFYKFTR